MEKALLPHSHGEKNTFSLQKELSQLSRFSNASDIFKQLSDTTRIRIFWLLCHQEECVINIAAMVCISSPAASHHLRSLHDCGLICSRRVGKEVYYRAADTEECRLLHKTVEQIMAISCPETTDGDFLSNEIIVKNIHDYLLQNLSKRISIEEVAKRFLINPTTLKKLFKELYGESVATHIKKHRMENAADLLRATTQSVGSIALSVGYESQSRFTTAFFQTYGILPTDYRKQNKYTTSQNH